MNSAAEQTDRYVSFIGISCDEKADSLINLLEKHVDTGNGDKQWHLYFKQKREQQARMQQDNLHFIGSQMNNLYAYLEQCADEDALKLLWQLEQECC
ncbi:N(2)-fixation sustaining protein CowN [Beggiatoa leptomitoformis]|uniref:N(2)-fixation sustaining protein CowN n=1 Tax=Beggiatoa leptomitoformis TaxID=288004 RepID=A0A2N9YE67_9GAMM|nr:N(2)-fixation sustaining protein CowN [Beggiatoa leptomitoformis]ALG68841.1 N(2)-fixation sustaining protein CowN [Beggiatoa leptomitoformis]AUI68791.1 N(2)-fixation sustaining protein CowN [Beggiatoa leptomitoformis]